MPPSLLVEVFKDVIVAAGEEDKCDSTQNPGKISGPKGSAKGQRDGKNSSTNVPTYSVISVLSVSEIVLIVSL